MNHVFFSPGRGASPGEGNSSPVSSIGVQEALSHVAAPCHPDHQDVRDNFLQLGCIKLGCQPRQRDGPCAFPVAHHADLSARLHLALQLTGLLGSNRCCDGNECTSAPNILLRGAALRSRKKGSSELQRTNRPKTWPRRRWLGLPLGRRRRVFQPEVFPLSARRDKSPRRCGEPPRRQHRYRTSQCV